jgi:hypothetical protein
MRALLLAVAAVAACDPAPGSAIDCEPTAAPEADDLTPPIFPGQLQAWLADGSYAGFAAESEVHDGAGPHGSVRVFVNRALATSLETCAETHPVGAAAVKELWSDGQLGGWSVMVKTREAHGAESWYWYEVFSTDPEAESAYAGQGHSTCTGCHDAGLDAVRTRWPLL